MQVSSTSRLGLNSAALEESTTYGNRSSKKCPNHWTVIGDLIPITVIPGEKRRKLLKTLGRDSKEAKKPRKLNLALKRVAR